MAPLASSVGGLSQKAIYTAASVDVGREDQKGNKRLRSQTPLKKVVNRCKEKTEKHCGDHLYNTIKQ